MLGVSVLESQKDADPPARALPQAIIPTQPLRFIDSKDNNNIRNKPPVHNMQEAHNSPASLVGEVAAGL